MSEFFLYNYDNLARVKKIAFEQSDLFNIYRNHYLRNQNSVKFYLDYLGEDYKERSLILFRKNVPEIIIPALCKKGELNFANSATEVVSTLKGEEYKRAIIFLFNKLRNRNKNQNVINCNFKSTDMLPKEIYSSVISMENIQVGLINCELTESFRKSTLRKSYKSLLSWGEKNLSISLIDSENPNYKEFLSFKQLHIQASGRKVRSDQTWEHQFNIIKDGFGYLVNAFLGDKHVSGCFIMHDQKTALYGVAASDRELMSEKLPLNHFTLWRAINTAALKNINLFILGDVEENEANEKKENNIALFKRGFASDIKIETNLKVHLN